MTRDYHEWLIDDLIDLDEAAAYLTEPLNSWDGEIHCELLPYAIAAVAEAHSRPWLVSTQPTIKDLLLFLSSLGLELRVARRGGAR